jgi:hypothetical protein
VPQEAWAQRRSAIPNRKLTLDFGRLDTIYGAEVADEWQNPTFTRGALYFLLQPFNHLGLRITADFNDQWTLKLLVVSDSVGVGTLGGSVVDTNETGAFGAQLDIKPVDAVTLQVGYLTGASGLNGNRAWGQFFDLILNAEIRRFTLTFNGSATVNPPVRTRHYAMGAQLSGDIQVHDQWKVGARVEYIAGTVDLPDGRDPDLLTVTAAVRYIPVQYLVISLEPRFERPRLDIFFTRNSQTEPSTEDPIADSDIYFGFVLGDHAEDSCACERPPALPHPLSTRDLPSHERNVAASLRGCERSSRAGRMPLQTISAAARVPAAAPSRRITAMPSSAACSINRSLRPLPTATVPVHPRRLMKSRLATS